jgi:hypothetical protein
MCIIIYYKAITINHSKEIKMSSDKDRFEEIIGEIKSLVEEAICLVPSEGSDRARSYWYAHIVTSLNKDHEYAAGSTCSMQNTLDEWEDRHGADQEDMDYYLSEALETAVKDNPGADGKTILGLVRVNPIFQGTTDKQIWDMADTMIEDDLLFFDTEEDVWYCAPLYR